MRYFNQWLLAVSIIPLAPQDWVELKYKNIASNQVQFIDSKIKIQVNQSASPLIHRLPAPMRIESFSLQLDIKGELSNLKPQEFAEDSLFRLGLVATGEKKLNWWQKKVAADWVLQLFSMAPSGVGLDKIYFYNVSPFAEQIGKTRLHPKSDLMLEEIVASVSSHNKVLEVNHQLKQTLEIVALWLSSDGDDTGSQFEVSVQKIALKKTDN